MLSRNKVNPFRSGERYGRLTILRYLGRVSRKSKGPEYKKHMYDCLCSCGQVCTKEHHQILKGETTSCGCWKKEINSISMKERNTTHGRTDSIEYQMWCNAKRRAIELKREFSITIDDIVVPSHCPVLGIQLVPGVGRPIDSSPSLDRIDPSKGYVKDNIAVVSYRLNRLKNSFSLEEMEKCLSYMKDGKETYTVKE